MPFHLPVDGSTSVDRVFIPGPAGKTMIALPFMEDVPKGQDIEREMGLLELQKIE